MALFRSWMQLGRSWLLFCALLLIGSAYVVFLILSTLPDQSSNFFQIQGDLSQSSRELSINSLNRLVNRNINMTIKKVPNIRKNDRQGCVFPTLDLWHPDIAKYFKKKWPPLVCSKEPDWIFPSRGRLYFNQEIVDKYKQISCMAKEVIRENDFTQEVGEGVRIQNGSRLLSDFFVVQCLDVTNTQSYTNIFAGVSDKPELRETYRRNRERYLGSDMGYNVLMFGFDSMSRLTWLRTLPRTHKYFSETLGGIVLEGYNIVGDGTPQALLPILTGKTESELPEARRGHHSAKQVDSHPWIWREFNQHGYITQWGEDGGDFGTFTYRMLGFKNEPVNFYYRTFDLASRAFRRVSNNFCLGALPRHSVMMNWIEQLYDVYPETPKFTFMFHSEYTHGGYNEVSMADDDLFEFLRDFEETGRLDNTILIFMSDHGPRFQTLRNTFQGKYEERMPYFGFRFPPSFSKKYPDLLDNFKQNSRVLSTPFDIHETFKDMLNISSIGGSVNLSDRGLSLFRKIPPERSCSDAQIEPHWCTCLKWTFIPTSFHLARRSAEELVKSINQITSNQRSVCQEIKLVSIESALEYKPEGALIKFKQSADVDGRVADLTDHMKCDDVFYQTSIITSPNNAMYEATVRYRISKDEFMISYADISRINKYGDQPKCVASKYPHLRPYCQCHDGS